MAFKPLIFVHSYSNIILQHQFFARGCLEAVLPQTWFCLKNKDFTFYWNYIVSIVIVIVIGNFHIKDNDLKFTNTWQWLFLTNSVFFFCLNRHRIAKNNWRFWNCITLGILGFQTWNSSIYTSIYNKRTLKVQPLWFRILYNDAKKFIYSKAYLVYVCKILRHYAKIYINSMHRRIIIKLIFTIHVQ